MDAFRQTLESHLVSRALTLADGVADERAARLRELVEEVEERGQAVAESEARLDALDRRLRELGVACADIERAEELAGALEAARHREGMLADRVDALRRRTAALAEELASRDVERAELERVRGDLAAAGARIRQLEERVVSLEGELSQADVLPGALKELHQRQRALNDREAELTALENLAHETRRRAGDRERAVTSRAEELERRERELDASEQARRHVVEQLQVEVELRIQQLERDAERLDARRAELDGREAALAQYVEQAQRALTRTP